MSIINNVRGRLSGSRANVDPHEWRLPSSYSTTSASGNRDKGTTVIPNPTIFRNVFVPSDPSLGLMEASLVYPDIGHAALHLALLECFRKLRLTASKLDVEVEQLAAYSEKPPVDAGAAATGHHHDDEDATAASPTRLPESERWDLLLRLAITRFTAWWMNVDRVLYHATAFTHHAGDKSAVQLTKDYLPPLDVLLVWYAFMLDSESYQTAMSSTRAPSSSSSKVGDICFPWPAIRDVLDLNTMTFTLPRAAENLFSTLSTQSADIFTYIESPPAYVECPELPVKIDLFDHVKQQEKFMDMAHDLLWIRSPALKGSLERASVEYLELQLSSSSIAYDDVPIPFGVDLIWRTHRLYPLQYQLFRKGITSSSSSSSSSLSSMLSCTDSKTPPSPRCSTDSLSNGSTRLPSECLCWTCERIRDEISSFSYDKSAPASAPAYDVSLISSLSSEQLYSIQDDLGFYKAVERARRRGLSLPTRPPTAAEKAAEKMAAKKQAELGRLPGLNEYVVTLPNGKKKIKRAKRVSATFGLIV
ncbi:hypothetical protein PV08_06209 [Exophiala spinifera]|uniref:Uncharacterized protein n=1 Tax=Exophiala spinifera TaxID=91928 RepID=A0A0D2BAY9_9EURO|nr:uncharacterized protein PV08_06209 [Exophiala spinifera]KIW16158.1 hypothetical protein PV08_06209 [Exophiala spinifera]